MYINPQLYVHTSKKIMTFFISYFQDLKSLNLFFYIKCSIFNLYSNLRRIFSEGLPEQFSFVTTYKNTNPISKRWHLTRVADTR